MPPENVHTYNFAIEEKTDRGSVIGVIGSHHYPIMGYFFQSDKWGRGYATEALTAWLQAYWKLDREDCPDKDQEEYVEATTVLANVASQRVLEKCGFNKVKQYVEDDTGAELFTFQMSRSTGERLYLGDRLSSSIHTPHHP